MTEDEFFENQFPNAGRLLQHLRAKDQEFDRICRDYKQVFAELAAPAKSRSVPRMRYIADLAESLSDLRSSIEVRLQAQGPDAQLVSVKDLED
ncbi:hypothetical protein [Roseibium sp. RKSG952]|uniref:hypothetical protein n=1 Tax=Roseibium sp. RKSG952 TaxID=2529384 RepID=UPI0012BCDE48|nr:hypothetical protein [Roseibium sp. RKSG952]MTI02190.1 hypothetical protein [Roseibium sp. RKSG952]